MNKRLIKRKRFTSATWLEEQIRKYMQQHNEYFAHPYNRTYSSVPEMKEYDFKNRLRHIYNYTDLLQSYASMILSASNPKYIPQRLER